MSIRGRCHMSLDDFKRCDWPTEFVSVPRTGEYVQGSKGTSAVRISKLKVVSVTHCIDNDGSYISIELNY